MSDPVERFIAECACASWKLPPATTRKVALDHYRAVLAAKEKAEAEVATKTTLLNDLAEIVEKLRTAKEKAEECAAFNYELYTEALHARTGERGRLLERVEELLGKLEKAEAELAQCNELLSESCDNEGRVNDYCEKVDAENARLRKSLEEIQRHHACTAAVFDIAHKALAGGGGERESR